MARAGHPQVMGAAKMTIAGDKRLGLGSMQSRYLNTQQPFSLRESSAVPIEDPPSDECRHGGVFVSNVPEVLLTAS